MDQSAQSTTAEQAYKIRHSTAHILAEAVLQIFPDAKLAIGPPIKDGFYYDFDLPRPLHNDDLLDIEKRMRRIIDTHAPFTQDTITRESAYQLFKDQPFKKELIDALPTDTPITTFTQNSFTDLCRGPHVESTAQLKSNAFKLLSIAGAYWRGDEKRPMLQRIYGTAWPTEKALQHHLNMRAEIAKRDHRKLGKELDLFSTHEQAGAGLIYWHPKGSRVRMVIEDYWRERHIKSGYEIVYTPHIGKSTLWEQSGHLTYYSENMFSPMQLDSSDYYAKPMNCPFHIMIYQTAQRSYRDLPFRWAELGTVYRYERSGVLHGLLRVRGFTQDDAHIFCTPNQALDEILTVLRFSLNIWKDFGFNEVHAFLATQPKKSVGADLDWRRAEDALKTALETEHVRYTVDEGGGAFYGPKIDLKIKDALGREWQMTTIQFDFNLPERFGMQFIDTDGKQKRPYMIHRALLGSLERFFGILIEHYGGKFPVWLAPEQLRIIPVAAAFNEYAQSLVEIFTQHDFRVFADCANDRLGAKIRTAHAQKIPYLAIVGEKEQSTKTLTVRIFGEKAQENYPIDEMTQRLHTAVADKTR